MYIRKPENRVKFERTLTENRNQNTSYRNRNLQKKPNWLKDGDGKPRVLASFNALEKACSKDSKLAEPPSVLSMTPLVNTACDTNALAAREGEKR